ncbi:MAG TPA: hypothetical protein VFL91_19855, partial [Thermomicrobiales bacterium]|nr:hypothetical protein [Thermomicrobiales bacterium]
MLQLVIAHGREPAFDIPAMLERDWEYALRWSLRRHVVAAPWANSIPVHFVFYGDLARPDSLGEWREKLAG